MVKIDITYDGQLACSALHGPSGVNLRTDAPADIGGNASSFSPTDLVATALGACIATTMDVVARRHGIDLAGTRIEVLKQMSTDSPRRIRRLPTRIVMPIPQTAAPKGLLENTARACPVHQSLRADIEVPISFEWRE